MKQVSQNKLSEIARGFIRERGMEDMDAAIYLFREEARALYVPEDDGDREEYWDAAIGIFEAEYVRFATE